MTSSSSSGGETIPLRLVFPSYAPSQSSAQLIRADAVEIRFGEGRIQRKRRGPVRREWQLAFNDRTHAEITQIDQFLSRCGGDTAFSWRAPRGVSAQFICQSWQVVPVNYDLASLSARFIPA